MNYTDVKEVITSMNEKFNMINGNYAPRSHYKFIMSLGRVWPCCAAQVKEWERIGCRLDVMNGPDITRCEELMNKHGYIGDYRPTKSKRWARLANTADLLAAFKAEFCK